MIPARLKHLLAAIALASVLAAGSAHAALIELADPAITNAATAANSNFLVDNLFDGIVDGSTGSQYASAGLGANTFVDFDFGQATMLAGFQHIERALGGGALHAVDTADLIFSDTANFSSVIATIEIDHVGTELGKTFVEFDSPVTARYVRWDVTALVNSNLTFVGGSEMTFYTVPEPATLTLAAMGGLLAFARRRQ